MLVFFVPPVLAAASAVYHRTIEKGMVVHVGVVEEEGDVYYCMSASDWESQPEEYKSTKRLLKKGHTNV